MAPRTTVDSGQQLLAALIEMPAAKAVAWTAAGLVALWALSYLVGGAGVVVPHWFYIPVIFAAVRFGYLGAFIVAVAAGFLAGPLTYQLVDAGVTQSPSEWLTRMGFFLGIGLFVAWVLDAWLKGLGEQIAKHRRSDRLRAGVERGELFLRYQPIIALSDGRVWGVEALVRWEHPTEGEISPADFLPLAAETGAIHDIDRFVLKEVCRQGVAWAGSLGSGGTNGLVMTVNLSGKGLAATDLPDHVQNTLTESGFPPGQLYVEVTESELIDNVEVAARQLGMLKALGVRCAVDDFGTGYSSLSYLRHFPLDMLKVDRSFTRAHGEGERAGKILKTIAKLGQDLDVLTVAEGIEYEHEQAFAAAIGCDLGQGFRFARPLTADDVVDFIVAQGVHTPTTNMIFRSMQSD